MPERSVEASHRWRAALAVAGAVAAAAIGAFLWSSARHDRGRLWSIEQDHSFIRGHALDGGSLAMQTHGSPPRVQVVALDTGKRRRAPFEGAALADSPAGQPAVLLELDAARQLHAFEILSDRPTRVSVEPPCPAINAAWFASAGSIVGLGSAQIAHVTADGRCRVSQVRGTTLNFWWAGIDSTGLVYVASDADETLYTLRADDGELRAHRGIAANEVLAVPTLPGAVVADRTSIALFVGSGPREVWRTKELRWAGPRAMARSDDFVAVRFDQAGARGLGILKARDGSMLERVRVLNGGAFALAGRCLLHQDLGRSDWVTFHVLGTGVDGQLAEARVSIGEGNPARVVEDIAFVRGIVLVGSGGAADAYRTPAACL